MSASARTGFVIRTFKVPPSLGYQKFLEQFNSRFPQGKVSVLGVYGGYRHFDAHIPHRQIGEGEQFWQEFCEAHNINPRGFRMSDR